MKSRNNGIKFVFAPINIGTANQGFIDKIFSDFYIERSGKNIDLTYIGNVAIDSQYVTNSRTPLFLNQTFLNGMDLSIIFIKMAAKLVFNLAVDTTLIQP